MVMAAGALLSACPSPGCGTLLPCPSEEMRALLGTTVLWACVVIAG
jgi:hypothetical protein